MVLSFIRANYLCLKKRFATTGIMMARHRNARPQGTSRKQRNIDHCLGQTLHNFSNLEASFLQAPNREHSHPVRHLFRCQGLPQSGLQLQIMMHVLSVQQWVVPSYLLGLPSHGWTPTHGQFNSFLCRWRGSCLANRTSPANPSWLVVNVVRTSTNDWAKVLLDF